MISPQGHSKSYDREIDNRGFCGFYFAVLPAVIFEDDDLLVVNKPPGVNTHAPTPYATEGLYDWLRNREPRWAKLAIIHRLDKETSGVIVFSKTPLANRSLTEQFTKRTVRKKYVFLTDREPPEKEFTSRSCLVRAGERYVSRPVHDGGDVAETRFKVIDAKQNIQHPTSNIQRRSKIQDPNGVPSFENWNLDPGSSLDVGCWFLNVPVSAVIAEPLTGRTHQIRVHAAEKGLPILGDALYGGTPAARVYLHAAELRFKHPATGEDLVFGAKVDFREAPRLLMRQMFIEPALTDAVRLIHGASDGWPAWYVERLGGRLLSQSEEALSASRQEELARLMKHFACRGAYHKILQRQVGRTKPADAAPRLVRGEPAPERSVVWENGLQFELSLREGYSVGLFLDQRDNRRRLITGYVAPSFSPLFSSSLPEVLNTFAYTCAFSVCAAKAGAQTTSLDLSKKYLDWGKRNFSLNELDATRHEFIYGDAFDWLRRLSKKGRQFDLILLDPPTFSQSKASGAFRAQRDYSRLVAASLPLLKRGAVLFASTNAASWPAEEFLDCVEQTIRAVRRKILQRHYAPQSPDFPASRAEPAYLKTVWLRIE